MTRLAAAGALLIALLATPVTAQPLSVERFANRIDALASAVRASDPAAAARLAPSVPASERVSAGGETYDVPLDWVRAALDQAPRAAAWPLERERLAARLDAISAEAERLSGGIAGGESARPVLTNVLADRRFDNARRTSWQTALQERIRDWLTDLLSWTASRGWAGRRIVRAIAWTASIAAVLVLLVWLTPILLRRQADRPVGVGAVGAIAPPGRVLGLEAAELLRAGRVRDGARAAYRAALRRMEEEGVLRLDASRTPRETLRLVAASHRRAAPLAAITGVFERIWYGSRPVTQDDASRLLGLLRELECLPSDRAN